jgi:hypothetical protein
MNVIDSKDALRYIATPAAHPETGRTLEAVVSRYLVNVRSSSALMRQASTVTSHDWVAIGVVWIPCADGGTRFVSRVSWVRYFS